MLATEMVSSGHTPLGAPSGSTTDLSSETLKWAEGGKHLISPVLSIFDMDDFVNGKTTQT